MCGARRQTFWCCWKFRRDHRKKWNRGKKCRPICSGQYYGLKTFESIELTNNYPPLAVAVSECTTTHQSLSACVGATQAVGMAAPKRAESTKSKIGMGGCTKVHGQQWQLYKPERTCFALTRFGCRRHSGKARREGLRMSSAARLRGGVYGRLRERPRAKDGGGDKERWGRTEQK